MPANAALIGKIKPQEQACIVTMVHRIVMYPGNCNFLGVHHARKKTKSNSQNREVNPFFVSYHFSCGVASRGHFILRCFSSGPQYCTLPSKLYYWRPGESLTETRIMGGASRSQSPWGKSLRLLLRMNESSP